MFVGREQRLEPLAKLGIVGAFAIHEFPPRSRIGEFQRGDKHFLHTSWLNRHGITSGAGYPTWRIRTGNCLSSLSNRGSRSRFVQHRAPFVGLRLERVDQNPFAASVFGLRSRRLLFEDNQQNLEVVAANSARAMR